MNAIFTLFLGLFAGMGFGIGQTAIVVAYRARLAIYNAVAYAGCYCLSLHIIAGCCIWDSMRAAAMWATAPFRFGYKLGRKMIPTAPASQDV